MGRNPGPTYSILKVITGSLYQGDPMFGATIVLMTMVQQQTHCASIHYFQFVGRLFGRIELWNSFDIDFIFIKGDSL